MTEYFECLGLMHQCARDIEQIFLGADDNVELRMLLDARPAGKLSGARQFRRNKGW